MELKVGVVCDRGLNRRRPVNQDCFLAIPQHGLFAVFDGVGGQKAGEVASRTAADTIEEALEHNSGSLSPESVRKAVEFANRDIYELAAGDPSYKTMATTAALVQIDGDHVTIAHVGDSRVYRFEKGRLYRETIDHTDLDDALRAGIITEEQAAGIEESHVINRALGMGPDVEVELKTVKINAGSKFLLCTDGVYRLVSDAEIAGLLAQASDPQKIAGEIKRLVHSRGADDNLTAVVVQAGRADASKRGKAQSKGVGSEPHTVANYGAPSVLGNPASGAGPQKQPLELQGQSAPSGRIKVDFSQRPGAGLEFEPGEDAGQTGPDEKRRTSALIIYTLVIAVLLVAAFYAGLQVSDMRSRAAAAHANANRTIDPLAAARAQFQSGDYQSAASSLSSIIQRQPQNADAHYWLGRTELAQKQFPDAAHSFEQAASLQPGMTDALIAAAGAYEAAGNRAKAIEMLQQYAGAIRKSGDANH